MLKPFCCFNPIKELIIPNLQSNYNDLTNLISSVLSDKIKEKWLIQIILNYLRPSKVILFQSLLFVDCDFIKLGEKGEIILHKQIDYILGYDNFDSATQYITIDPSGKVNVTSDNDEEEEENDEEEEEEEEEENDEEDNEEAKEIDINISNNIWTIKINKLIKIINIVVDLITLYKNKFPNNKSDFIIKNGNYTGSSFQMNKNKYIIMFQNFLFLLDEDKLGLICITETIIYKIQSYLDNIIVISQNNIILINQENTKVFNHIYDSVMTFNNNKNKQYISILYQKLNYGNIIKNAVSIIDIKNGTLMSMSIKEKLNSIYTISSNSFIGITNKGKVIQYFLQ
jgi:hypothetical protein